MWIVLCSSADHSALWMFERLQARRRAPVSLVLVEELSDPRIRWEHRVGTRGALTRITLPGGRQLPADGVSAVLNRLTTVPLTVLAAAETADRDYVMNELTAFTSSWLGVLAPKVINRPAPQGFAGRWRRPLEWRVLAGRAGLRAADLRLTSTEPLDEASIGREPSTYVLAVDGHLFHPLAPPSLQRAVHRFSALAETQLLGLRFDGLDPAAAGWRLLDATPQPDLSLAGEDGVAAVEAVLAG